MVLRGERDKAGCVPHSQVSWVLAHLCIYRLLWAEINRLTSLQEAQGNEVVTYSSVACHSPSCLS